MRRHNSIYSICSPSLKIHVFLTCKIESFHLNSFNSLNSFHHHLWSGKFKASSKYVSPVWVIFEIKFLRQNLFSAVNLWNQTSYFLPKYNNEMSQAKIDISTLKGRKREERSMGPKRVHNLARQIPLDLKFWE